MPPMFKVALLDTVSTPPDVARFAVKVTRSKVPLDTERLLLIVVLTAKETVLPVFAAVRLLNVVTYVPPIIWADVPLKVTVAVPPANAAVEALLVQLPTTPILKLFADNMPAVSTRLLFTVIAFGKRSPLVLLSVRL